MDDTVKHRAKLVLASASPRRVALLMQIGVKPDHLHPANIDETATPREHPRALALRLSKEKALVAMNNTRRMAGYEEALILAADTVVSMGRTIMDKPENEEQARICLQQLSGKKHKVHTAITLLDGEGKSYVKLVESRIRFMRLTSAMIDAYIASGEWQGKAGGYAIQGLAGAFVTDIKGSYSNVVGLPLAEAMQMLSAEKYPVLDGWPQGGA